MLIRSRLNVKGLLNPRGLLKSRGGIWFLDHDFFAEKHRNILALLERPEGRELIPASNIVTNAGDLFYAQLMAGEATTNTFTTHEMATAGTPAKGADRSAFTALASSQRAEDATYPRTNDPDADNTGAGTDIRTSRVSYPTGEANGTISHGIITNPTPGASEPILTGYAFASSFTKTSSDTLKVFVNHEALGV